MQISLSRTIRSALASLLAVVLGMTLGTGEPNGAETASEGAIAKTLSNVTIGQPVIYQNLVMFPLLGEGRSTLRYLTLNEGLEQGVVEIGEVDSAGSVSELQLVNRGKVPVLLVDGEELVGAKQNRILTVSLLAPSETAVTIPAACVEAGRWASVSQHFRSVDRVQFASGRANLAADVSLSLREMGAPIANQSTVWNDIAAKAQLLDVHSSTEAMADVFEENESDLDVFVENLVGPDNQVGAVFVLDGTVAGIEVYENAETFAKMRPKLIRSYALDAISFENEAPIEPAREAVENFINVVLTAKQDVFPSVGLGAYLRINHPKTAGGALVVGDALVHLAAFPVVSRPPLGHRRPRPFIE
jgi:hypothetical protein